MHCQDTSLSAYLIEDIFRLKELAGIPLTEAQTATKEIGIKLKGIAKIWYLPYTYEIRDDMPWWTLVYFQKEVEKKVMHRLADLQKTSKYEYHITDGNSQYSNNSQSAKVLSDIRRHINVDTLLVNNPGSKFLVIFCTPKEIDKEKQEVYYHVSYRPLQDTGITPSNTIKWTNRIYLWENPQIADQYAENSFQLRTLPVDSYAYIYKVFNIEKVFHDHEERKDAVYVKHFIPPENIKLIKKIKVK